MKTSAGRVGVRLARRELWRTKGRTLLVVLMIVVPTCAMGVVVMLQRTSEWSAATLRAADFGAATWRAQFIGPDNPSSNAPNHFAADADLAALLARVPAGTPYVIERRTMDRLRTATKAEIIDVTDVDIADPLLRGRYRLMRGHVARSADEAVIDEDLAKALALHVGSAVRPQVLGRVVRIVGIMRVGLGYTGLLATRDVPAAGEATSEVFVGGSSPPPAKVPGWLIASQVGPTTSHTDRVLWTYLGGSIGLFALGTIVAAAFALGARRQLRSLGLLSASGASPAVVAWVLVAQGAVCGVIGSLIGVGLALLGVYLLPVHYLQSFTTHHAYTPAVRPADLAPIVIIGVLAAVGAATFPARSAARLPTLQALASRRPVGEARRRSWAVALLTLAASAVLLGWMVSSYDVRRSSGVLLATIIAGVLPFVSTLIAAPLVVSKLEGWSTRAALPWRLAGRSLGRNRARSASVIGATCAVVGLAIALPTFFRSFPLGAEPGDTGSIGSIVSQPDAPPYIAANQVTLIRGNDVAPDALGNIPEQHGPPPVSQPVDEATARQVRGVVANARRVDLEELRRPDGFGVAFELDVFDGKFAHASFGQTPPIAVATPELLDLFGVHQRERHNLASGDVLVIRPAGASVHLARQHPQPSEFYDALHVTGVVVSGEVSFALPRYLLNPATAQRLGWHSVPAGETVFAAPHPLTKHQRAQLSLLSSDNQWAAIHGPQPAPGSSYDYTTIDWGQPRNRVPAPWLLRLAAFGAVALFVLAVVGIGLGLSARDTRDETEVLDAVGAPPVLRRKVSTRRAALLVVVACVIALPAALVPVAAMAATTTRVDAAFRIDWLALAAAMIGLPLVVAFATAAGARVRDLVRPLQPSVLSYTDS